MCAGENADPSKVIKESYAVESGAKAESFSRSEEVSMGDPEKYSGQGGVTTFRGGPLRQNASYGTVDVTEGTLTVMRGIATT